VSRPLTDDEREIFDAVQNAGNIALVQTQFDGEETAVIAAVYEDGDERIMEPLAVLVTDAIMARLMNPFTS
jgi:hypothetical protein